MTPGAPTRKPVLKPYSTALACTVIICLMGLWWVIGGPDWMLAAWLTSAFMFAYGLLAGRQIEREVTDVHLRAAREDLEGLQTDLAAARRENTRLAERAARAEQQADLASQRAESHLAELNRLRRELSDAPTPNGGLT